jgi:hypothetical protein
MDEKDILLATLNSTIGRTTKLVQSYEIEIANLTAEVIKLQTQLESMSASNKINVKDK